MNRFVQSLIELRQHSMGELCSAHGVCDLLRFINDCMRLSDVAFATNLIPNGIARRSL